MRKTLLYLALTVPVLISNLISAPVFAQFSGSQYERWEWRQRREQRREEWRRNEREQREEREHWEREHRRNNSNFQLRINIGGSERTRTIYRDRVIIQPIPVDRGPRYSYPSEAPTVYYTQPRYFRACGNINYQEICWKLPQQRDGRTLSAIRVYDNSVVGVYRGYDEALVSIIPNQTQMNLLNGLFSNYAPNGELSWSGMYWHRVYGDSPTLPNVSVSAY